MKSGKKKLYRDPKNGKLGGICAGLAEYFGLEIWIIRLFVISAFLFSAGFFVVIAYIAACFILDELPAQRQWQQSIYKAHTMKKNAWQSGHSAQQILKNVNAELDQIENSIEQMESYVTSFTFKMDCEFRRS